MTTTWCAQPECSYGTEHHHCASCGLVNIGVALCPHHACVYGDEWAAGNRLLCDGLHRGQWPARLPSELRSDDVMAIGNYEVYDG